MASMVTRSQAHGAKITDPSTKINPPGAPKKGKGAVDTVIQMVATTRLVTNAVPATYILSPRAPNSKGATKWGEEPRTEREKANMVQKANQADAQSECSLTPNRTPAFIAVALVIGCIAGIWLGAKFFSDNTEKLAKAYQENKNLFTKQLFEECRTNTSQIVKQAVGQCQEGYQKVVDMLDQIVTAKSKVNERDVYPLKEIFLATQETLAKQQVL